MRRGSIDHARKEAERFLDRLTELQAAHDKHRTMQRNPGFEWEPDPLDGSKLSGSVRRASLDLTRALAEMRKP